MSIGGKIRFLLVILGACCIITALSLKHSITKKELLAYEGNKLQQSLTINERIVNDFLSDTIQVRGVIQYPHNEEQALNFIDIYRSKGINMFVYKDGQLRFWSTFSTIPSNPFKYKEGSSFSQFPNGSYELIKKTSGNTIIIFLIEIKNQYKIHNDYLQNEISSYLSGGDALSIAKELELDTYEINNLDGKPLFNVRLKPEFTTSIYTNIEVWLWVIGIFSFCLFFNSFCAWLAKRGQLLAATALIALFFLSLRITDLEYRWISQQLTLEVLGPEIYAESFFMPSLGDFLLNVIAITWIVLFVYTYNDKYRLPDWLIKSKIAGLVFHAFLLLIFAALAFLFDKVFFGLIMNSKIKFDVTNIINLQWTTWVSIVILCLVWFNIYIIANIFMQLTLQLRTTNKERLILFLTGFLGYLIYKVSFSFSIFFIFYAVFIFIIGWNAYVRRNRFSIGIFALLFFCLASISSIKYLKFLDYKENSDRKIIAQKLASSDDYSIISVIEGLEREVGSNKFVQNYFKRPTPGNATELKKYINKQYLANYLPRFDYKIYDYNNLDSAIDGGDEVQLNRYKNLVQVGSVKAPGSRFFYRLNDTFGYQIYFGIIPVFENGTILGTMVIELKSQPYNYKGQVPDILVDGKMKNETDYGKYSIAFYNNGKLETQSGKYTYKLAIHPFASHGTNSQFIKDSLNYTHLVYAANAIKTVIISKENVSNVMRLATLSFFFLIFILFSITLYTLIWLLKNIDESWSGWFNINRSLMINANKILYKTRIQFSIVLSVVATLLIVGWTTYFYIQDEYRKQQEDFLKEKIRKVQYSYEKQILLSGIPGETDKAINDFNQFADINGAQLNLYDIKGDLIFTSLSKLYDLGILSRKMGSKAFIHLSQLQRSEYINHEEKIGKFIYTSAYAPIRNAQNQTVAFINVPYYANETDYQNKIGVFINTLINIYALVFVAIGVLAVFLANQITNPLTFIQDSIRKTKLGQRNRPIVWPRHDEIGSLIKEYNKMIAALEDSAIKLARSERESAWREMAKQVAHEIKNPLTPLKLGVQLLEKSWKEKDPNFEGKFERFNKSFIEQIDSLSNIASAFSNFAKMPDTKLEKLQLLPIILKAREVFANTENVEIQIQDRSSLDITILGDKDQLMRIFNNLLKNAIEAALGDQACIIKIGITNNRENVLITIADNGKGIDEALKSKIFVPNFTTKSSGTGLGLAFVKQAVENAGGTVDFRSSDSEGTTFFISFPLYLKRSS